MGYITKLFGIKSQRNLSQQDLRWYLISKCRTEEDYRAAFHSFNYIKDVMCPWSFDTLDVITNADILHEADKQFREYKQYREMAV